MVSTKLFLNDERTIIYYYTGNTPFFLILPDNSRLFLSIPLFNLLYRLKSIAIFAGSIKNFSIWTSAGIFS